MGICLLSGMRSKDPSTQVGACIVDTKNRIVSVGYNGFINGCDNDDFPWEREGHFLKTKYPYVVHAEQNAILNAGGKSLDKCKLYVNIFPCHDCAKIIIQSGITKICYLYDKYTDRDSVTAAKYMFEKGKVELIQLDIQIESIHLKF